MNRQSARRKVRKRKSTGQNSRVKFGVFLGIMLLAVFLGYLTARFVVGPLIGYDAGESPAHPAEEIQETETTENSSGSIPSDGYALQFGAFSSEAAAQELSDSLKTMGIETDIVKAEDIYKVISPVLDTREKALEALSGLPETAAADVFIASFG